VKLFDLMRDMRLPDLAMAGGAGRELLRNIKYEALGDYRREYGTGAKDIFRNRY
jgi:hypothetical protein